MRPYRLTFMASIMRNLVLLLCLVLLLPADPSAGAAPNKTYTSEQFGFSFDYPSSWSVQERSVGDGSKLLTLKLLSPDENVAVLRDYSPGSTVRTRIFRAREFIARRLEPVVGPLRDRRW